MDGNGGRRGIDGFDHQAGRSGNRAPFAFSEGTCEFCRKGLYTNCLHGGFWGQDHDGGQAEAIRAPFADGTLVVVPKSVDQDEALLKAILPLTDVMGTGHYAAVSADVHAGGTVAIVGDGAVGLCGVLAARRLGAQRIILLGHQTQRLELARRFGATDLITSRGEQAEREVIELTGGGAELVMECVGTKESMDTAIAIARPGGSIGYVGVPHGSEQPNLMRLFLALSPYEVGRHLFGPISPSCSPMCWPDGSILLPCSISPSISMAFHRATLRWISAKP